MKSIFIASLIFLTFPLWANCPDLAGVYEFDHPDSRLSYLSISQTTDPKGVIHYEMTFLIEPYFTAAGTIPFSSDGTPRSVHQGLSHIGTCQGNRVEIRTRYGNDEGLHYVLELSANGDVIVNEEGDGPFTGKRI